MAKSPAKRNKKYDPERSKTSNVRYVVNQAMGKFYIVGDRGHKPISFGFSDLYMKLKGAELKIAKDVCVNFLFGEKKDWKICFYHFFDFHGVREVAIFDLTIPDVTCASAGDLVVPLANETKRMLAESEEYGDLMNSYLTYGFYMTWLNDDGLNLDGMEPEIIESLFKVGKDFHVVPQQDLVFNGYDIIDQVGDEKFSMVDKTAMVTDFAEYIAR